MGLFKLSYISYEYPFCSSPTTSSFNLFFIIWVFGYLGFEKLNKLLPCVNNSPVGLVTQNMLKVSESLKLSNHCGKKFEFRIKNKKYDFKSKKLSRKSQADTKTHTILAKQQASTDAAP